MLDQLPRLHLPYLIIAQTKVIDTHTHTHTHTHTFFSSKNNNNNNHVWGDFWAIIGQHPSASKSTWFHVGIRARENRLLVTNELVEFEKQPIEVRDIGRITNYFRGIYRRIYFK
jgi:hypothetical protein